MRTTQEPEMVGKGIRWQTWQPPGTHDPYGGRRELTPHFFWPPHSCTQSIHTHTHTSKLKWCYKLRQGEMNQVCKACEKGHLLLYPPWVCHYPETYTTPLSEKCMKPVFLDFAGMSMNTCMWMWGHVHTHFKGIRHIQRSREFCCLRSLEPLAQDRVSH